MSKIAVQVVPPFVDLKTPPDAGAMPPAWGCYVTVDDVDAIAERVPGLGGKVFVPPMDIPGVGRFTVIADPQGAVLNLITYVDAGTEPC